MKAPPTKKGGRPLPRKTATAAKLIKITPERQIVEHLQTAVAGVHRLPLLTGKLGCEALDCLELIDKFRTGYRDRVIGNKGYRRFLKSERTRLRTRSIWSASDRGMVSERTLEAFSKMKVGEELGQAMLGSPRLFSSITLSQNLRTGSNTERRSNISRSLLDVISLDSVP